MTIAHWPTYQRPREKLLAHGAGALSDAELLAIFLRTGIPGKSAVALAKDCLSTFSGLRNFLQADITSLLTCRGLGNAKCVQLKAILEVARRYLNESVKREDALLNTNNTREYLAAHLRDYEKEVFACLFLDSRNRVICYEELFHGTINSSEVHPREVVKRALCVNAASVIFAHNHPSGVAEPSQTDIDVTKTLTEALKLIDIRVLDHFIVGDGYVTSFCERGLL